MQHTAEMRRNTWEVYFLSRRALKHSWCSRTAWMSSFNLILFVWHQMPTTVAIIKRKPQQTIQLWVYQTQDLELLPMPAVKTLVQLSIWRKVNLMFFFLPEFYFYFICLFVWGFFLAFLFKFFFFYSRLTRMPPGCLQGEVFQVYPIRISPVHAGEMYGNVLVFLPTPQQRLIQSFIMKINIHMWKSLEMPWYLSCVLSVNLLSSVKKMGLQWWTC